MKRQKGVTVSGLLITCAILVGIVLIGFKLFPAYAEYLTVKKALKAIGSSPESRGSPNEIRAAFARTAAIDNIKSVSSTELEIGKQGDRAVVSASWSVRVPLFYNISACMDFEAKSTDP